MVLQNEQSHSIFLTLLLILLDKVFFVKKSVIIHWLMRSCTPLPRQMKNVKRKHLHSLSPFFLCRWWGWGGGGKDRLWPFWLLLTTLCHLGAPWVLYGYLQTLFCLHIFCQIVNWFSNEIITHPELFCMVMVLVSWSNYNNKSGNGKIKKQNVKAQKVQHTFLQISLLSFCTTIIFKLDCNDNVI